LIVAIVDKLIVATINRSPKSASKNRVVIVAIIDRKQNKVNAKQWHDPLHKTWVVIVAIIDRKQNKVNAKQWHDPLHKT